MDRWVEAADWIVWQLCGERDAQRLHRRLQGDLPGRRATRRADYLRRARTRASPASSRQARRTRCRELGARAGGLTAEAAGWTGLPEGIAVAVGNVDAHVTAPGGAAIEPGRMVAIMGTSTCHVMNGDALAEVPGHVRRRRRRDRPRRCAATRPARAASATSSAGSSTTACRRATTSEARERGLDVHELPVASSAARAGGRASTAWSRSTGGAATARCSSTTS